MKKLELREVSFAYPGRATIFQDLSIGLEIGDRLALTGPNGAGKTTLFKLLVGLLLPQQGSVHVDGQKVHEPAHWRTLRRKVAMVFQDPDDQLFCPTLLDDVAFGPLNMGLSKKEAKELSLSVLDSLGLTCLADNPPYALSGGQKKLGSLATVLSMRPSFLLLDEPSAGLDEEATGRLIQALTSFPGGFLVASHDRPFLESVTDSGIRLGGGNRRR